MYCSITGQPSLDDGPMRIVIWLTCSAIIFGKVFCMAVVVVVGCMAYTIDSYIQLFH